MGPKPYLIDVFIEIRNVIAKPVTMDSTSSIGHQIVEASSSIDANRVARALLDAGEEISSNKTVFEVPSDRDPAKIAIWISGILLALAITTFKYVNIA